MCRRLSILAFGVLILPAIAGAQQQNLDDVKVEAIRVSGNVYMLTGAGGNIGVSAGPDVVFLVDDQYAPLTERIKKTVESISTKPIEFVLNTHWHGDHTGGNENLGQAGVLIIAHDNVRKRMSVEQFMELFGSKVPASPKAALPVVTFGDRVTFHINGDEIDAFHVPPAHTDGDSIVHFKKSNVLHLGDLFFNGFYPFIDVSSGGSVEGIIKAADRALAISDQNTKIIPGHGPLADRNALSEYRRVVVTARDRVTQLIKQGKTMEQVLQAQPMKEFDAKWGSGFMKPDVFLKIVYSDLSARK